MLKRKRLEDLLPAEKVRGQNLSGPSFYASGTVWPHGEWSLGYGKELPESGEWHENPIDVSARAEAAICDGSAGQLLPLNLSDGSNSHRRPKRGLSGITGYGQQMIKACGFLMGERWPQHRKTLGTITLPPMDQESRREVVLQWSEMTRQLLQWLTRRLERLGLPPIVCSVTEVQPKRLSSLGEGYLHWHLMWLNIPAKAGHWSVSPSCLRSFLAKLLKRLVPSYGGGFINVNVKAVKGEAAKYLAKYMSKGKQQIEEAAEDWGEDVCPSTWWNMTGSARAMVKSETFRGREPGQMLEAVLEHAWSTDVDLHFEYLRHVELEFDGVRVTVGWRGRFVADVACRVRSRLKSVDINRLTTEHEAS
jgi:hypothetical protein